MAVTPEGETGDLIHVVEGRPIPPLEHTRHPPPANAVTRLAPAAVVPERRRDIGLLESELQILNDVSASVIAIRR